MVSSQRGGASSPYLFTLGTDLQTKSEVQVSFSQLQKGLYAPGVTGSGKSTLLWNVAKQAVEQHIACVVISPVVDLNNDILSSLPPGFEQNVINLNILSSDYVVGLNLFQCANTNDEYLVSRTKDRVLSLMEKLFVPDGNIAANAPYLFETVLAITILLIYNQGYNLNDIPDILSNKDFALRLAHQLPPTQRTIQEWWETFFNLPLREQHDRAGSFRRRLMDFLTDMLSRRIVGVAKSTIDLRSVIDSGKLLLVSLDTTLPVLSELVGATIVQLIANAVYSRVDTPLEQRKPCLLLVDEFQRFSTKSFADLLTECRKFGIATCIAHQYRGQLPLELQGATLNVGNLVVFQVQSNDAKELAGMFHAVAPGASNTAPLSQNLINTLLSDGHPRLTNYITKWLRPLQQARAERAEQATDYTLSSRGSRYELPEIVRRNLGDVTLLYTYDIDEVKRAMTAFNDWLYNAVRFAASSHVDIPQSILRPFSYVLGFGLANDFAQKPNPFLTEPQFAAMGTGGELLIASCALDILKHLQVDQYAALRKPFTCMVENRSGKKIDTQGLALKIASTELLRKEEFTRETHQAIEALRSEPIYASAAKYGASSLQSTSEMIQRIAQDLTFPGQWCARVRLGFEEHKIQALPLPAASRSAVQVAQLIKQNNIRDGYLRRKEDVDREMNSRARLSSLTSVSPAGSMLPASLPFVPSASVEVGEEPDNTPAVPQFTPEQEKHRRLFYAANGYYPVIRCESEAEKKRRLFYAMNGYFPALPAPAPVVDAPAPVEVKASPAPSPGAQKQQKQKGGNNKQANRKRTKNAQGDDDE